MEVALWPSLFFSIFHDFSDLSDYLVHFLQRVKYLTFVVLCQEVFGLFFKVPQKFVFPISVLISEEKIDFLRLSDNKYA